MNINFSPVNFLSNQKNRSISSKPNRAFISNSNNLMRDTVSFGMAKISKEAQKGQGILNKYTFYFHDEAPYALQNSVLEPNNENMQKMITEILTLDNIDEFQVSEEEGTTSFQTLKEIFTTPYGARTALGNNEFFVNKTNHAKKDLLPKADALVEALKDSHTDWLTDILLTPVELKTHEPGFENEDKSFIQKSPLQTLSQEALYDVLTAEAIDDETSFEIAKKYLDTNKCMNDENYAIYKILERRIEKQNASSKE